MLNAEENKIVEESMKLVESIGLTPGEKLAASIISIEIEKIVAFRSTLVSHIHPGDRQEMIAMGAAAILLHTLSECCKLKSSEKAVR